VRGRKKLLASDASEGAPPSTRAELERYASLFNARDWDGVRALIADDCRLDLVSRSDRRGKQVGMYFDRYEKAEVRLRVVGLDGAPVLAAYLAGAKQASYFILLEHEAGRIKLIRDFRYVPYIALEAEIDELK
jgi:RNA polymerase sigma-70 factor (ECF subfamily)